MVFVFGFIHVVDYFYTLVYVEATLHSQDEAYLIVMDKLFDVLLHLVCQYFIADFCINVHHGYWPKVFFFGWVSARFWYQDDGRKMSYGRFPLFILFAIVSEGMVPAPLFMSGRIQL